MEGYNIIKKLKEKDNSKTYKVRGKDDNQIYIIKELKLSGMREEEKTNLTQIIKILSNIKDNNIITIYNWYIKSDDFLIVVLEYADKGNLEQMIKEWKINNKKMKEKEIINYLNQITNGLKMLHDKKIIHRNLKSSNIFLFNDGTVKIGDLFKCIYTNDRLVKYKKFEYHLYYSAPEIIKDNSIYTNKIDIWSLGCILYEMVNLDLPYKCDSKKDLLYAMMRGKIQKFNVKYSNELYQLILRLLQYKYEKRPVCNKILSDPLMIKYYNQKDEIYGDKIYKQIYENDLKEKSYDKETIYTIITNIGNYDQTIKNNRPKQKYNVIKNYEAEKKIYPYGDYSMMDAVTNRNKINSNNNSPNYSPINTGLGFNNNDNNPYSRNKRANLRNRRENSYLSNAGSEIVGQNNSLNDSSKINKHSLDKNKRNIGLRKNFYLNNYNFQYNSNDMDLTKYFIPNS